MKKRTKTKKNPKNSSPWKYVDLSVFVINFAKVFFPTWQSQSFVEKVVWKFKDRYRRCYDVSSSILLRLFYRTTQISFENSIWFALLPYCWLFLLALGISSYEPVGVRSKNSSNLLNHAEVTPCNRWKYVQSFQGWCNAV